MLSYVAHYKNKYPGGHVDVRDDSLDAFCSEGKHRVALRKNGQGQWQDESEKLGCEDRHDLSPLPQNACFYKHYPHESGGPGQAPKSERVAGAEEHDDRRSVAQALADCKLGGKGKVPSLAELEKAGVKSEAGSREGKRAVSMESFQAYKSKSE